MARSIIPAFLAVAVHTFLGAQTTGRSARALATSVDALLGDSTFVSVQSFGAVPNDGIDDSAAFQAAVAWVQTNPTAHKGGTVYVPVGEYDFSSGITVTGPGVRFVCGGGLSFNEGGEGFYTGAMFIARTNNMILLDFNGDPTNDGDLVHQGPQVENCNFVDQTVSGHTATLLRVRAMNRY